MSAGASAGLAHLPDELEDGYSDPYLLRDGPSLSGQDVMDIEAEFGVKCQTQPVRPSRRKELPEEQQKKAQELTLHGNLRNMPLAYAEAKRCLLMRKEARDSLDDEHLKEEEAQKEKARQDKIGLKKMKKMEKMEKMEQHKSRQQAEHEEAVSRKQHKAEMQRRDRRHKEEMQNFEAQAAAQWQQQFGAPNFAPPGLQDPGGNWQ